MLSFEFYLIVLLLITLVLGGLYIYYDRKKGRHKEDPSYLEGLKFMAEGENRRAIEKFKEAVRLNSENVDAYLKIGVILRQEKLYNNAIRVHKDLLLRGNLDEKALLEVKRNLALDYWGTELYEKAEPLFEDLKSVKSQYNFVVPYLRKIYEDREEWENAFQLSNRSTLAQSLEGKAILAEYKVRQGHQTAHEKDEKSARTFYKEGLKIDQSCALAYLSLGDSYLKEGRQADAIRAWKDLFKNVPDKAYMVFNRLERALYEKGQFSKIEELYLNLINENEENLPAIISLANIYRKKGEYAEAMRLLQQAQKKDVDTEVIQAQMIKVLVDQNQFKEASQLALHLIEEKYDLGQSDDIENETQA
jgi:lipopolysaccharide biosynthesis regulator YciM